MKTVLILGAGIYQVPLIECAKRKGCRVVVASIPGNYPGFSYADEVAYIDTLDKESLLELAREKNVSAVLTAGTDVAIPSVGYLCEKLGLPGINAQTGVVSTTKTEMKRRFAQAGVRTAAFEILPTDADEATIATVCEGMGYPVILKAVDSSGSRGIVRVTNQAEIAGAMNEVRAVTRDSSFIVERYLVGMEFGLQLFMQNGTALLAMPHGDYVSEGSTSVPMGHYVPFDVGSAGASGVDEAVKASLALGIRDGAVNVDAILCDGEVYIIEVGARAGATLLSELVSVRYGFDYYETIVRRALGEEVVVPEETNKCAAAMVLCPDSDGEILQVEAMPEISDNVPIASLDVGAGDVIRKFHVGPDRIGQVLATGSTLEEAEAKLADALGRIRIKLVDGSYVGWLTPKVQNA